MRPNSEQSKDVHSIEAGKYADVIAVPDNRPKTAPTQNAGVVMNGGVVYKQSGTAKRTVHGVDEPPIKNVS